MPFKKIMILLLLFLLLIPPLNGTTHACSSFAVYSNQTIYGWNLDWTEASEARISLRKGYRDIKYLILDYRIQGVYRPTMGMNNKGILVTAQSVPPIQARSTHGSSSHVVAVFEWILTNASSIEDVERYLQYRTIVPAPGFYLHLHIADIYGNTMILEVDTDGTKIIKNQDKFSVVTNFYNNRYPDNIFEYGHVCQRYDIISDEIIKHFDQFDHIIAYDILDQVKQYSTRVSMVYFPERLEIHLAFNADFDRLWRIDLNKEIIETYQGFSERQVYPLTVQGITSSMLGVTFPAKLDSKVTYTLNPEDYKKYTGLFKNNSGTIEIVIEENMLYYISSTSAQYVLIPESETQFAVDLAFINIQFVINKSGEITGFLLKRGDTINEYQRVR